MQKRLNKWPYAALKKQLMPEEITSESRFRVWSQATHTEPQGSTCHFSLLYTRVLFRARGGLIFEPRHMWKLEIIPPTLPRPHPICHGSPHVISPAVTWLTSPRATNARFSSKPKENQAGLTNLSFTQVNTTFCRLYYRHPQNQQKGSTVGARKNLAPAPQGCAQAATTRRLQVQAYDWDLAFSN